VSSYSSVLAEVMIWVYGDACVTERKCLKCEDASTRVALKRVLPLATFALVPSPVDRSGHTCVTKRLSRDLSSCKTIESSFLAVYCSVHLFFRQTRSFRCPPTLHCHLDTDSECASLCDVCGSPYTSIPPSSCTYCFGIQRASLTKGSLSVRVVLLRTCRRLMHHTTEGYLSKMRFPLLGPTFGSTALVIRIRRTAMLNNSPWSRDVVFLLIAKLSTTSTKAAWRSGSAPGS
jgi:hypothetical protein